MKKLCNIFRFFFSQRGGGLFLTCNQAMVIYLCGGNLTELLKISFLLFLFQSQTSSGKTAMISSLMKLKDALQAQSKDHKPNDVPKQQVSAKTKLFRLLYQLFPLSRFSLKAAVDCKPSRKIWWSLIRKKSHIVQLNKLILLKKKKKKVTDFMLIIFTQRDATSYLSTNWRSMAIKVQMIDYFLPKFCSSLNLPLRSCFSMFHAYQAK